MKIGLIILFILYLSKLVVNRFKGKGKVSEYSKIYKNVELEEKEKLEKLNIIKKNQYLNFLKKIEELYGEENLQLYIKRRPWKDMPKVLLLAMLGNPDKILKRETINNLQETFYYGIIPNARSNAKRLYFKEVYLENGNVIDFDFLNKK